MRAKEFISEDKQKLDEIAPLAVGLYLATAGLTAVEMKNIYDDYKSGKITGPEALKRAGIQAGAAAMGGLAGKVISKAPAVVGAVAKPVKDIAKKVVDKVKSKPDAKTTKPKPDLKSTKQKGASIKQDPKVKPGGKAGAAGAAVGAGLKKGKDFVKKQSKGSLTPAGALAGAAGGKAAIDAFDKLSKGFDDWDKNRSAANTAGDNSYVYTGDKKDPPKSDFVAKNLDLERLKAKK
jgi:hypothetical protein